MPFLSAKTPHIVDRVLWMLPFATNTDLNEAAKKADVSHESRNGFLQKLLGDSEHSIIRAQQQLKELWGNWIDRNTVHLDLSLLAEAMVLRRRHPKIQTTTRPDLLLQGQLLQRSRQLLQRRRPSQQLLLLSHQLL
jgi:hypothetical protein